MLFDHPLALVGNTPTVRLRFPGTELVELFAKLEYVNPTGSVKDRAAAHILDHEIASGRITKDTLIVESSSGNFGIALAAATKARGLRFCCVIDPRINKLNELLLRGLGADVIKVDRLDPTGGYLRTRLRAVHSVLEREKDAYWTNQYENSLNSGAYEHTLAEEVCKDFDKLDYVFVGVSSGGTITGISHRLKRQWPDVKIIAVDTIGSIIFGGPPAPRWLPGIGASVRAKNLDRAQIDDVVLVEEIAAIRACHELWREHAICAGGSSGSVLHAIRTYFTKRPPTGTPRVLTVLADRGDRYADTIFDEAWCAQLADGTLRRSVVPPPPEDEGELKAWLDELLAPLSRR
jgi:2,3-diaminopropionate biosynthesis protein SbnA